MGAGPAQGAVEPNRQAEAVVPTPPPTVRGTRGGQDATWRDTLGALIRLTYT